MKIPTGTGRSRALAPALNARLLVAFALGLTLSGYPPGHAVEEGCSRWLTGGGAAVPTPSTSAYVVNDPCGNAARSATGRYRVLVDLGSSAELDIVVNRGHVGHCLDD
jgi:hypothetical protein